MLLTLSRKHCQAQPWCRKNPKDMTLSFKSTVPKHGEEPDYAEQAKGAFDTFVNVMVDNMVSVMHDEDVDDEVKKVWCANETEVNEGIKSTKEAELTRLASEMEEIEDNLATLADEIK